MGLSPEQFYQMRLKDYFLKLQYYNRNKESETRLTMEQTRLQTTALVNIQLKPADRLKPSQLWPLPWDVEDGETVEKKLSQMSREEIEKSYKEFIERSTLNKENG